MDLFNSIESEEKRKAENEAILNDPDFEFPIDLDKLTPKES